MRITTLLFFTFLLSFSLSSKLESLRNAKFAKTKLGKFIVNFAQFSSSLSEVDYDPLFDALDALVESLENQLSSASNAHASAEETHNNLVNSYETARDSAQSDVTTTTQTLVQLNSALEGYQSDVTQANDDIEAANEALATLESDRTDRIATYNANVADANSGVDSIDEALELLASLQTTSDTTVFIQTNEKALSEVRNKMRSSFESLSNKKKRRHFRYRPLLMAVVEIMSNQNYVNQDTLAQIISLLTDLRASLVSYVAQLDADEAAAEELYTTQLEEQNTALALAESNLETAETNVENTNATIATEEAFLETRSNDYQTAVDNLDTENSLWERKVTAYNTLVDEINDELAVVEEAVEVLNNAGIARSTSDEGTTDETTED